MKELSNYFKIAKRVIQIENDDSTKPKFSPVFDFPFTDDYCRWVQSRSKKFPKGRKPRGFWNGFYDEIIENQIKPVGVKIPQEWYTKLISYPTNSVYLIADDKEKLLYIGKCEYSPVIRLLDRLIPKMLNPSENNVPQIWDNYLGQGQKVKCVYCYNLSFDPELLEYILLYDYRIITKGLLPVLNKKMPNMKFHKHALRIRSKLK